MRGIPVDKGVRLLQVFLSPQGTPGPGIFEVSLDTISGGLECTCAGFNGRKSCKHTRFVKARIEANNGNYPFEISTRMTAEDEAEANTSDEAFREFIIKFGKIEVF
jgi:hypothetical protein